MMDDRARWIQEIITDDECKLVERCGYGKKRGLGQRPCVMLIDAQHYYLGDNLPIMDQIEQWPSGCGENAWKAVPTISAILDKARGKNVPVFYTRQIQKDLTIREKLDSFGAKIERRNEDYLEGAKGVKIIDELAPKKGDFIIDKAYASVFYGTPLIGYLIKLGIDSILIMGGTTSGCLRSTVVDASARNYDVGVVMDCVFDRIEISHRTALLDMWMKYADIVTSEEAIDYLASLLPQG